MGEREGLPAGETAVFLRPVWNLNLTGLAIGRQLERKVRFWLPRAWATPRGDAER